MRKRLFLALVCFIIAIVGVAVGQEMKAAAPMHVMKSPAELTWGDPPPVLEKGSSFALVSGDPGKPGLYCVRLKMPAGYRINPHWHPTDEHVTVISGSFMLGMGEKFDEKVMTELPAGGYGLLPAEMRHYAMAKTDCIVQVHGTGPFTLTYVNPSDDPSKRAPASGK